MPNFDINSRFNKEANFSQVVFGEDGYVLETELNEMQHIQDEARASLIRESIHSGVLNYFEPTMLTTTNAFKLGQEMKVNVNGQILTIPKDTMIQLNEPPTADFQSVTGKIGYREDLVFLEAWQEEIDCTETVNKFGGEGTGTVPNTIKDGRVGVETTRRIQWKWRIRVVNDVNMPLYNDGLGSNKADTWDKISNPNIPLLNVRGEVINTWVTVTTSVGHVVPYVGWEARGRSGAMNNFHRSITDKGIWICGEGTTRSKDLLGTSDGAMYALPLFSIKRRNTGEFSSNNIFGGSSRESFYIAPKSSIYLTVGENVGEFTGAEYCKVGDIFRSQNTAASTEFKILSVNGSVLTFTSNVAGAWGTGSYYYLNDFIGNRPDKLLAKLIYQSDITDLRHTVSLTGFNFNQLLDSNFNDLLIGKLNTKDGESLIKTYHGLSRNATNSSNVLYASLDGTTTAEIGGEPSKKSNINYDLFPSGLGIVNKNTLPSTSGFGADYVVAESSFDIITIECFAKYMNFNGNSAIVGVSNPQTNVGFSIEFSGRRIQIYINTGTQTDYVRALPDLNLKDGEIIHIRVCKVGNQCKVYLNGKLFDTLSLRYSIPSDSKFNIVGIGGSSNGGPFKCAGLSDVSVSLDDRGSNFLNIPQDLNTSSVSKKFNKQRTEFGSPTLSQFTQEVIKNSGGNDPHITVSTQPRSNWASGDTIRIVGHCNELISGVIDTDTALARVTNGISTTVFEVDSVSKLSVGDTFKLARQSDLLQATGNTMTITAIDSTLKQVTYSGAQLSPISGYYLVESTVSSSSPVLKYKNGANTFNVLGTWSGLGTSVCTFTFGDNPNLTNQDLEVQYSLIGKSGDSGFNELMSEVLSGEYRGHKLTKSSALVITDDLYGKESGKYDVCPSKVHIVANEPTLLDPTTLTNVNDIDVKNLWVKNGKYRTATTGNNPNKQMQMYFSFNLIRMVEDKFGEIPSIDKIQWLRDNVESFTCNWTGYADSNSNTCKISGYTVTSKSWNNPVIGTSSTDQTLTRSGSILDIDDNGFVNYVVYTDTSSESDVITLKSDYVSLTLTLKTDSSFEILSPENTRRDAGRSGALLVRKDTKEVNRLPIGKYNDGDNIFTYCKHIPPQAYIVGSRQTEKLLHYNNLFVTSSSSYVKNSGLNLTHDGANYLGICERLFGDKIDASNLLNEPVDLECATMDNSGYSIFKYLPVIGFTNTNTGFKLPKLGATLPLNIGIHSFRVAKISGSLLYILPMLLNIDDEIYLGLVRVVDLSNNKARFFSVRDNVEFVKLKGRPLIKEVL